LLIDDTYSVVLNWRYCKRRYLIIITIIFLLSGCSSLKEDNESLVETNRVIEELANERDGIADVVEDKEIIDFDPELSDEELIEWNNRLANIMYFIPDFIEPGSIDKTELLEGIFLYGAYEEMVNISHQAFRMMKQESAMLIKLFLLVVMI